MKTKLFTTNSFFVMIMTLVLALGVQGIADALTFGTTRTGDLQTVVRGESFSVTFAVTEGTEAVKDAYTDYIIDPDDDTRYFLDRNSDSDYDSGEPTVTIANRSYYNNEAVRINVSGAGARITSIGTAAITPATSIILKDGGSGVEDLVASVVVNCSTTTHGEVTITASDATPSEDYPSGVRRAPNFVLTTYVVQFNSAVGPTRTIRLHGVTNGVAIGYDDQRDQPIYNGDGSHYPVTYTIPSGSGDGMLYIQEGNRTGTPAASLITSTAAKVLLDMGGSTNKITATLTGSFEMSEGIYIFGNPRLNITGGNDPRQSGAPNAALGTPLAVTLTDSAATPAGVVGVPIKFDVTDKSPSGGILSPVTGTIIVDASNEEISSPIPGSTMYVRTGTDGVASIAFQLGTIPGEQTVTASALNIARLTKTIKATATGTAATRQLFVDDIDRHGSTNIYTLVARVENGGQPDAGETVTFTTTKGLLTGATTTAKTVTATTNAAGKARVTYNIGDASGNAEVVASISVVADTLITQLSEVTFNVRGGSSRTGDTGDTGAGGGGETVTPTITVSSTSIRGAPGSTQTLTATASPATTRISVSSLSDSFITAGGTVSPATGTGSLSSTLTLPSTPGTYSLRVFTGTTARQTVSVTVTPPTSPASGRLTVRVDPFSGTPGTTATVTVTATDSDGQPASITVTLSATGGTLSPSSVTTGANGTGTVTLTRGSTPGSENRVTASATDYDTVSSRFVISDPVPPPDQDQPQTREAGEAAAIDVYDGDGQRGTLNVRLAEMLVVEVTDANGNPVSGERVTFRTTIGSGRFSPSRPRTNGSGRAQAWFTPTSSGSIRIAASVAGVSARAVFRVTTGAPPASLTKVSGDSQSGTAGDALANPFVVEVKNADGETIEGVPVAFSVTAGGGRLSATSATTDRNGRAQTTLTLGSQRGVNSVQASVSGVDPVTFSTSIDAKILVAAANRPVMYWIAGGALYRLAGAKEVKIAESVNGVAIGGGKLYWTTTTGASAGTINAANLDGSGAKVLTRIMAVPMGIAVDTADSKLYWTNARGRIQSANLNGSGIRNVLQNLSSPTDLVVSSGFIYWTENGTAIKRVNLKGQKQVQDVAVNLDTVGGLAVGGGKVYWTEATGASAGTVNGANLDGTQFETLATLLSAPMGISVDTANSKLYWTNSRGRVQSANLDGSMIRNVVDGLISPSQLLTGGANTDEPVTRQSDPQTQKDTSAYDINGDGKVDSTDTGLIVLAISTGDTSAKFDVNGDGKVNFSDYVLVSENVDAGAAGAPSGFGIKMTAIQIERLQEQIDLLIASGDRSPAAMRALIYFQQLIATARPEKTQLLANYPNPFNPETWMPYELATDTDVRITIYNAQGVVIRTLQLGQQSAGYYTDRERAAYWDGRNAFGEQVASGVYFYQLETDEMSSMRKMVILK